MHSTSKTLEAFALGKDRDAVVAGLPQGTTEHAEFLYHHLQNKHGGKPTAELKELYEKVKGLNSTYSGGLRRTALLDELQLRQQLLEFESNEEVRDELVSELQKKLHARFDHQREVLSTAVEVKQDLPSELDEKQIDTEHVLAQHLKKNSDGNGVVTSINGFTPRAYAWLAKQSGLQGRQLESFLRTLPSPTENIVELLTRRQKDARGVDILRMSVCHELTIEQLRSLPAELRAYDSFVTLYLKKLETPRHLKFKDELGEKRAYFERVYEFAKNDLHASRVSQKACIYFNRLKLLAELGEYDLASFLEYLAIDRPREVYSVELLRNDKRDHATVASFSVQAGDLFDPIVSDAGLIQEYLTHFFRAEEPISKFSSFFDAPWLERVRAETMLLSGTLMDTEEVIRVINNPRKVELLRERIDIEFAKNNKKHYKPDDDIRVRVFLKNVPSLVVKVFEINTKAYYRKHNAPLSTDINLEGLQAKYESTHDFSSKVSFERFEHTFEFADLKGKKGVFVVDLIGNGVHSRAILQIGAIRVIERESVAGHVFTLLNERNEIIKNGEIVFNGTPYTSKNEHGTIYIKYRAASDPLRDQQLLLTDKDSGLTCRLGRFTHQPEKYTLTCGIFCDRESLLEKAQATVVVRPRLLVNGNLASVKLLENVSLTISTTERRIGDSGGTESSKKIDDFKVSDTEESAHTFTVPKDLRRVEFTLEATVKTKSTQKVVKLEDSRSYTINVIDDSDELQDVYLTKAKGKYVVSVLGKTGEPRVGAKVFIELRHAYLDESLNHELQTDAHGQVVLGVLTDILEVEASSGRTCMSWRLVDSAHAAARSRRTYNFMVGQPIAVPVMNAPDQGSLRLTDGGFKRDYTNAASMNYKDGFIEIADLEAGGYILAGLHNDGGQEKILINVCDGVEVGNYAVSGERLLEINNSRPLQIVSVADGGHTVQLANWTPETRVHVVATHFDHDGDFSISEGLGTTGTRYNVPQPREIVFEPVDSQFLKQRLISEEYRYVLERKNAKKYMGNMLERPSLLNNPWSHKSTKTSIKEAAAGERMHGEAMGGAAHMQARAYADSASSPYARRAHRDSRSRSRRRGGQSTPRSKDFASFEFLSCGSRLHLNLKPDMNTGVVTLPSDAFGAHHHVVSVLAVNTDYEVMRKVCTTRELGAPWTRESVGASLDINERFQDVRLYPGLDPEISATQQRNIRLLQKGEPMVIEDYKTGEFEAFERLGEVFSLYRTLAKPSNAQLMNEFSFVAKWHKLDEDSKLFKYDKYSCHELNFFLFKKDPEFFKKVVAPFLRVKTQKTFIDHYLLGNVDAMRRYCEPFAYSTLNVVEKILLASILRDNSTTNAANTLRFFEDKVALMRVDAQQQERLFKTALKAKSLESDDAKQDLDQVEEVMDDGGAYDRMVARRIIEESNSDSDSSDSWSRSRSRSRRRDSRSRSRARAASSPSRRRRRSPSENSKMKAQTMLARFLRKRVATNDEDGDCDDEDDEEDADYLMERTGGSARYHNKSAAMTSSLAMMNMDMSMAEAAPKPMFQQLDETKEYEETQYYKVPWDQQRPDLISMSRFWADYARHMLGGGDAEMPFLSQHFVEATNSFPEIMFALAVQGFPFESVKEGTDSGVKLSRQGHRLTLRALQPVAVFVQELLEAEQAHSTVMINQEYFDPADPDHFVDGETVDKFVTGEFLHSRVYGCRVTLTNVSTATQNIEVLMQIPQGAIPVSQSSATRTQIVRLSRYTTQLLEVRFYFPFAGEFRHFPAQVSKNQKHIGRGNPKTLKVVSEHTTADLSSWRYVSQEGTNDEVLAFLREKNVHEIDLASICWRMQDREFFVAACAILRDRLAFAQRSKNSHTILTYALKHGTSEELRELFLLHPGLGSYGASKLTGDLSPERGALVEFDSFLRKKAQHLEYAPLVNARAHQLGKERTILNDKLQQQYTRFLKQLCYKGTDGRDTLPVKDRLEATYYLLLQDRIDEAIELFQSIPFDGGADGAGEISYDYMRAYLDFYTDDENGPQEAFDIAAKYRNCPIHKKKKLFAEIERQLSDMNYQDERVDHPDVAGVQRDVGDRDRLMDRAASSEVSVEASVESGKLMIDYLNVDSATVNFYEMDIELLFSTTPFMKEGGTSFAMVSPNRVLKVELPAGDHHMGVAQARRGGPLLKEVAVPDDLQAKNVFIEVIAGGIVRTTTHYANKMLVQVTENYGQLRVTHRDSNRPIRKAYVKVYAKMKNGSVQFFKDGYTDLRGKFDYVSISTAQLKTTEKFSILVFSENAGAVVREAKPPEAHK